MKNTSIGVFRHTKHLPARVLTGYWVPVRLELLGKKKPKLVDTPDSKSQMSQDETVTQTARSGISRNFSNFDRLYLRAQGELEARKTCFRKP